MRSAAESLGASRAALAAGLALVSGLAACGQPDFNRQPVKPPMPIQLTGVITNSEVTISPSRIGAGPIVLIVSNQDGDSHSIILEGERKREQVGPVNPQDTATITTNLQQGRYKVSAASERAMARAQQIEPTVLSVGRERATGEDDLLRP